MLGSLVYHYQISFKEDLGPIKLQGEKFYNKPILAFEEKFQKVVVNQEDFEERRIRVWAPLLYCHDVGRIQN